MTRAADLRPSAKTPRRRRPPPVSLMVPHGVRLYISPQDFWDLCCVNRKLRLERTSKGRLIVMAPAGSGPGLRNGLLFGLLFAWARQDGTGLCFDSSAGFTLLNSAVRAPDASWIARPRWDALPTDRQERFAPICPDFAAELMSPSDTRARTHAKMLEYVDQGVRLAWLIDRYAGEVEVHRPSRPFETLTRPAALSGEDVLPGFVLDLAGILYD